MIFFAVYGLITVSAAICIYGLCFYRKEYAPYSFFAKATSALILGLAWPVMACTLLIVFVLRAGR